MPDIKQLHGTVANGRCRDVRLASILRSMESPGRRGLWRSVIVGALFTTAACASSPAVVSRPSPFPRAPAPEWASSADTAHVSAAHALLQTATALRGSPYRLGGTTPTTGFDCSGFVRYVFQQYRLDVPRTVAEQFRVGREVDHARMTAGDLIFFSTTGPGATHVGIVVDPDARTFVHAPGTGSVVRIERFDTPYWQQRVLGVRRLSLDTVSSS